METTLLLALYLTGPALSQSPALGDEEQAPAKRPAAIEVAMSAAEPSEGHSLRWSPKGAQVSLNLVGGTLRGRIVLGPSGGDGGAASFALELSKHGQDGHFEELWIDFDRDGTRSNREVLTTNASERKGKFWSSFECSLSLPIPSTDKSRAYPISLWYVEDPSEPRADPVLRWSRRGWHAGTVVLAGRPAHVLITEMRMDGVFDEHDAWSLSSDEATYVAKAGSRPLSRHAWLDDAAYKLVALDPNGEWIRIEPFDPGVTRAEEERQEDALAEDRNAKRAPSPVAFSHDYESASRAARTEQRPLLIDFETTWCGPCKEMDAYVYTSQAVVDTMASARMAAVKVDGDERKDLVQKYKVEAYPTMILIDSRGKELRRRVGYQSVKKTSAFLAGESTGD